MHPPPALDADLLARASRGDQRAFRRLYEQHAAPLYRFVLKFASTPQDAEEILSECFLAALDAAPPPADLRNFLFTAGRNRALNRKRDQSRRLALLEKHGDDAMTATTSSSQDDEVLTRERALAAVETHAASLPAAQARLYQLKTSGLSEAAIARTLAVPAGTIKSRWHHLVRLLRKEVEPWTAD